jgi:hypothetical protein
VEFETYRQGETYEADSEKNSTTSAKKKTRTEERFGQSRKASPDRIPKQ